MPLNTAKLISTFLGATIVVILAAAIGLYATSPSKPITAAVTAPQTAPLTSASTSLKSFLSLLTPSMDETKKNLTQSFAKNLANDIVSANTAGPAQTKDAQALVLPKESDVNQALAQSISGLDPQSIGFTTSLADSDITIINQDTLQAAHDYFTAADGIARATFASDSFTNLVNGAQDQPALVAELQTLSEATDKLKQLPVPRKLADYHKRLILSILNLEEIGNATQNMAADPIKTVALVQSGKQFLDLDVQAMRDAYQKIDWNGLALSHPWQPADLFAAFLPAQAHAQAFVPVRDDIAEELLRQILDVQKTMLQRIQDIEHILLTEWDSIVRTQQAKYDVTNQLQQDVLNWVLNNNDPQFIQNWQDYLLGASSYQAAITLEDLASANALDPEVQNNALSFIEQSYLMGDAIPKATLDQTIQDNSPDGSLSSCSPITVCDTSNPPVCTAVNPNVCSQAKFYNDFNQGGFAAYEELLKPQNNLFGATMIYSDVVSGKAALAAQAANSEGIASNGFLSQKVCVERTAQGDCRTWAITLPGVKVADALDAAMQSAIDEIVNSQYLPDCIPAIWQSSLIMRIIINEAGNADAGITNGGNPLPPPDQCQFVNTLDNLPSGSGGG